MTEDISNVKCGCGFNASGPDQEANRRAFEGHTCFDRDTQPANWYSAVFSFPGAAVLFVAGWVAIEIVKAVAK